MTLYYQKTSLHTTINSETIAAIILILFFQRKQYGSVDQKMIRTKQSGRIQGED